MQLFVKRIKRKKIVNPNNIMAPIKNNSGNIHRNKINQMRLAELTPKSPCCPYKYQLTDKL